MLIEISATANPFSKKYAVRTKRIELAGRGIDQHHTERKTGLYNVYSATKAAISRIKEQYPNYKLY